MDHGNVDWHSIGSLFHTISLLSGLLQSTLLRLLLRLASSLASHLFPLDLSALSVIYSLSTPYCFLILLSPNSSLLTPLPFQLLPVTGYFFGILYFQRVISYMNPPYPPVTEEANLE